jgi:hypothetical protein
VTAPAPRPTSRRVVTVSALVGVPVAGLAIAAVSLLPMLTATSTSVSDTASAGPLGVTAFESLSVGATNRVVMEDEVWVIPVTADWASFPTAPANPGQWLACTDAQHEWLETNGDLAVPATEFGLANTATSGANLSIFDLRLEGQVAPSEPSLEVHCRSLGGGMGGAELVISLLGVMSDAPAVVEAVEGIEGADVSYTVGEQVAFNLRPGDQAALWMHWESPQPGETFRGNLMASISSGDRDARVALPNASGEPEFVLPTPTITGSRIDVNQGALFCVDGGDATTAFASIIDRLPNECSPATGMVGAWHGDVEGDRNPYSLSVTITESGGLLTAAATYPEIPCTATWQETSRTTTEVFLTETVDPGSRCFDQVPVTLRLVDGSVGGTELHFSALSGGYALTAVLGR